MYFVFQPRRSSGGVSLLLFGASVVAVIPSPTGAWWAVRHQQSCEGLEGETGPVGFCSRHPGGGTTPEPEAVFDLDNAQSRLEDWFGETLNPLEAVLAAADAVRTIKFVYCNA